MLLFLQFLFLMLTYKFPWLCHHRLSSLCSVTQWCIPPSSVPPFNCSGDSADLFVSLDSQPGLHPGFIFKNQCFAVLVLNVNFIKVVDLLLSKYSQCPRGARSGPPDTTSTSLSNAPSWSWQSEGEARDSNTWQIPLQALIATMMCFLKEKIQVVGEHVNLWNVEPDLGSEEGFLMRPVAVVRLKAECRGEADHLQGQAEKP